MDNVSNSKPQKSFLVHAVKTPRSAFTYHPTPPSKWSLPSCECCCSTDSFTMTFVIHSIDNNTTVGFLLRELSCLLWLTEQKLNVKWLTGDNLARVREWRTFRKSWIYHVYNEQWEAITGEELECQRAGRRTVQSQWHCILCKNHAYTNLGLLCF